MSNLKSMYAIAKLKKNIKGFGLRVFKEEALQVYKETCQLLAEGDLSRLRQVKQAREHSEYDKSLVKCISTSVFP